MVATTIQDAIDEINSDKSIGYDGWFVVLTDICNGEANKYTFECDGFVTLTVATSNDTRASLYVQIDEQAYGFNVNGQWGRVKTLFQCLKV